MRRPGLVATAEALHPRFRAAARGRESVAALQGLVDRGLREAAARCAAAGKRPASLSSRSRRAYQWMHWVADGRVETQVRAVAALQVACARLAEDARERPARGAVNVAATHMGSLFRRRRRDEVVLRIHAGFVPGLAAETGGLASALVRASLAGDGDAMAQVRGYAAGAEFAAVRRALARTVQAGPSEARGRWVDLGGVFRRVNAAYFDGALEPPTLRWSERATRCKMGHYDPVTDTVEISRTLDDASLPALVVDYVMFHELLHKHLGIRVVNGVRRAHTPAFRHAEGAFVGLADAQAVLDRIAARGR